MDGECWIASLLPPAVWGQQKGRMQGVREQREANWFPHSLYSVRPKIWPGVCLHGCFQNIPAPLPHDYICYIILMYFPICLTESRGKGYST